MVEYEDVLLQDSDLSQTQKVYYVGQCADYYEDYVHRLPALSPRVDQMNEHKQSILFLHVLDIAETAVLFHHDFENYNFESH